MDINNLDEEYLNIVKNILNDKDFIKLNTFEHHGITRFDHSLKVSYNAYKYAKKHNLDYKEVAVGGLLHDFFDSKNVSLKDKFISTFNHSNKAEINSLEKFNVNEKEANIIKTHMFPLNLYVPKYKESWIVSLYDKKIGMIEFINKFKYNLKHSTNLILLVLLNFIK